MCVRTSLADQTRTNECQFVVHSGVLAPRFEILTAVDDTLKQHQTFCHPILPALLQQDLVILAQSDAEDDTRDRFETVDPLLPLASLTSDVEEVDTELAHVEPRLCDARRLAPRTQHIVLVGDVVVCCDAVNVVEEVRRRVHQVELARAVDNGRHHGILPQRLHRRDHFRTQICVEVGIDAELEDTISVLAVLNVGRLDFEFAKSQYDGLCRIDEIS